MDLKLITSQVCNITHSVGEFVQNELHRFHSSEIVYKGRHDLVTYVDKTAEERIIEQLSKLVPGAGFMAEESPHIETKKEIKWIIDPLDGTTNFIHGVPVFCISIALEINSEIVMGVVYEINRDECFYSWKGAEAFLNNKTIRVSETTNLDDSLLATGFPYYDYGRLDEYLELFRHFMKHTRGVRRLGSAAADLAYVACGRFDGFYEYGLQPWDVAAGSFIVKQAGGLNSTFCGTDNYIYKKEIISSNFNIYKQLLLAVENHFTNKNELHH